MEIINLDKRSIADQNEKLKKKFIQFENLLTELKKEEIPDEIIAVINNFIEEVNTTNDSEKELRKQLKKSQTAILKLIEKELQLVTINHYRNTYLAIGVALGIAFGSVFGTSLGNMAFMGVGLPIGMAIGIAIGTQKDKEAKDNGKQLDVEIK